MALAKMGYEKTGAFGVILALWAVLVVCGLAQGL